MTLLNKTGLCEKCQNKFPKSQLCTYDLSHQGRIKGGHKLVLCQECSLTKFFDNLPEKLVIVEPMKGYNSYAYYDFSNLMETSRNSIHQYKDIKFITSMSGLLPPDHAKCSCGKDASYTWCSSEVFYGNPFKWEFNSDVKYQFLCKHCLKNLLLETVKLQRIYIKTIFPPLSSEGFCTPWDV